MRIVSFITKRGLIELLGTLLPAGQGPETKNPLIPKYRRGKVFQSGPGATRTRDLLLRRQALYPAELRTRNREGKTRPGARFPQPLTGPFPEAQRAAHGRLVTKSGRPDLNRELLLPKHGAGGPNPGRLAEFRGRMSEFVRPSASRNRTFSPGNRSRNRSTHQ